MPISDFTPTVGELAGFMKSRTKTRMGLQVGTFNDTTPVTAEEAEGLIAEALDEIALAVGPDLPEGSDDDPEFFKRGAKSAVLILSSMNVELQLAPEQVVDPRSPYAALERRLKSLLDRLIEAVSEARGGLGEPGDSVAADSISPPASGTFPPPMTTLTEKF